jgi:hypothetical protein
MKNHIAEIMIQKRKFPFAVTLLDIQLVKIGKAKSVRHLMMDFPKETVIMASYFNPKTQRKHVEVRFKTERDMADGMDFLEPTFRNMRVK